MSETSYDNVLKGYIVPGLPHPLLAPELNSGYQKIRDAFEKLRKDIETTNPDVLLIYSTMWPSILGHQVQALAEPKFTLVDDEWHELGSIPYEFKMDVDLAKDMVEKMNERGLHARTTAYESFPVDTGSVVALKLLNPKNKFKAVILSSNIYSDRAETVVHGKAILDALESQGKKAVAVSVTQLSNRFHTDIIDFKEDKIVALKDQEWNMKYLEFLGEGRLEDVSQLSRQFHKEARVKKVNAFKPFWWLSSVLGPTNLYEGDVLEYQPVYGAGAAVVKLERSEEAALDLEYDENEPEHYHGDRNVLAAQEIEVESEEVH